MASEYQTAFMRASAVERLETAARKLAKRFEGVKGLDQPLNRINGRGDPDLAHAKQLEALAGVLDQVVEEVETSDQIASDEVETLKKQLTDAQTQVTELTAQLEAAKAPQTPATVPGTTPPSETGKPAPTDQGKGGK